MARAAFIVVEGLDRSGKTTQIALLQERLQKAGKRVKSMKFPDRTTPIGKMIDSYLRSQSELDDHVIHLLFSANRWELASAIKQALEEETVVVCDRYAFSGIAFSAAKGLNFEWCRGPDASLPEPDLTIFLDIQPEKARERGGYGNERYEKEDTQKKVREVFRALEGESDSRTWVTLDAGQEREVVAEDIWKNVSPLLEGLGGSVRHMWV